jgi:hypothetical protein
MIAVAGPRIDPNALSGHDGLEIREKASAAIGAMELTANQRPFIYFPLKHHFEQNFHVHHRLTRYGAGRRMDFDQSPPDAIAAAIASELGHRIDYRPVSSDGAARAAALIAEVL